MKIRLGYVSISNTIDITSSHTITYKNYSKLDKLNKTSKLDELINLNLDSLYEILKYNLKNEVYFYRMTSALIPLATHELVKYDWSKKFDLKFLEIGKFIKSNDMRVDIHIPEFCVLNSNNPHIVHSSINILKYCQTMLKKLDIESKLIMHVGSTVPNKKEATLRFIKNFKKLDINIQKLIALENDDKNYTMVETLNLCNKLNIPMVLDVHHHNCLNNGELIENYICDIFKTWGNDVPKIHFSSPKNKKEFKSHNEYINVDDFIFFLNRISFINKDFDVMIEAKGKDLALFKLIRQIKYKTDYKFIKNTIFLI